MNQKLKVAVLQSSYVPWKGYFDIINNVDLFIFYDDVQYTKNDWRNRNLIKTSNGTRWLTIPTGSKINRNICDVNVSDKKWKLKHWKSILQSYSKSKYFEDYKEFFEEFYLNNKENNLSEINQYLIKEISTKFLGITTKFSDSRNFKNIGKKGDRLLNLLQEVGACSYLSGPSAKSYIDSNCFMEAGITLQYQSYDHYPEYPQLFPPFDHQVSIIDLLFNTGSDAPRYIWGS